MACAGLTRHRTKGIARDASRRSYAQRGVRLYPYDCSTCGGWHLSATSQATYRTLARITEPLTTSESEAKAERARIDQGKRWHARTGQ